MNALVPKNADHVIGVLSGWGRLVFRGTLRLLSFAQGMAKGLRMRFVRYLHYHDSRLFPVDSHPMQRLR